MLNAKFEIFILHYLMEYVGNLCSLLVYEILKSLGFRGTLGKYFKARFQGLGSETFQKQSNGCVLYAYHSAAGIKN